MAVKKGVKYLSESEMDSLRTSIAAREGAILGLLYETGCRVHELVSLRFDEVDLENGCVRFGDRQARISARLAQQLVSIAGRRQTYVFSTRQSERMTTKRVRQIVQLVSRNVLGVRVSPQAIRYSHIAHALRRGVPMSRIGTQVGLKSLRSRQLEVLLRHGQ